MKDLKPRPGRVVIVSGDRLEEACGGIIPDRIYREDAWPEEVWSALGDAVESLDEMVFEGPWPCDDHISTGQLGSGSDVLHILGVITDARCSDGCPGTTHLDDDALYDVMDGTIPLCRECGAPTIPADWRSEPAVEARDDASEILARLTSDDRIVVILPDETGPADEDLAEWLIQASARGVPVIALDWNRREGWPVETWILDGNPLKRVRDACLKPVASLR